MRSFLSGWADPREEVHVSPGGYSATADADGAWSLQLNPAPYGRSITLTVSGSHGGPPIVARNVSYGDVILCGGGAGMLAPTRHGNVTALPRNLRLYAVANASLASLPPVSRLDVPSGSRGWFRSDDPDALSTFEAASALCIEAAVQFTALTAANRILGLGEGLLSRFCVHYQRNAGLLSRDVTH
eukprot:SAG31_NODE_122_length_23797_cov_39.343812_9_plen_185_part_00